MDDEEYTLDDELKEDRERAFAYLERNFESMKILHAVDYLDQIRYRLADGENLEPPEVRQELMKLHEKAQHLINYAGGKPDDVQAIWDLAWDIESVVGDIQEYAEKILSILSDLAHVPPAEGFDPDMYEYPPRRSSWDEEDEEDDYDDEY